MSDNVRRERWILPVRSMLLPAVAVVSMLPIPPVGAQVAVEPARDSLLDSFGDALSSIRVPFEWRDGMVFLDVTLNGSRPLKFVLDSGSTRTLVDTWIAAELRLRPDGRDSLQGAGAGRVSVQNVHDVTLGLPGLNSSGHEISVADLQPLQSTLRARVDGILGYEFFSRFVLTVDYAGKMLEVARPAAFKVGPGFGALPISIEGRWPYVAGELVLPGPVTVQDRFLIDSGSSDAVDHPIVKTMQASAQTVSGVGLGAPVEGAIGQATAFRLGSFAMQKPPVACCGATDATSKLIGIEVLRRFTVIFDYPDSKLYLKPNRWFDDGFPLAPARKRGGGW